MNVLLAHGSPDARHGQQVAALANTVSSILDTEIETAFLCDEQLPHGATVLPLFLGGGKHVREDIPKLAASSQCHLLPSLASEAGSIVQLVTDELSRETRRINVLFALYRFAGFEQLTTALYDQMGIFSKHALATLHGNITAPQLIDLWHQEGVRDITLQPMLLFEGRTMDKLRHMQTELDFELAPVISQYAGFAELVANAFRKANEA